MRKKKTKRRPDLIPKGMLSIVAEQLGCTNQLAWHRIHKKKDPVAIGILKTEIEKQNKERDERIESYKELEAIINN